ncbi:NAD(P)-binding protein [Puniceicoccales bacterium CK1056]|uniref:NAD(P)-binding protein n=1 Tax=Oceanipulchritudo coccoides TaxID=2706888 RepID=A0A6B2M5Q4_9BACT|nr:FAD-dependent oxidoreductase [Oceanipulchritudo coccoides]NDV63125.1 NAD(P)-binding protein [Oceanipulchritudo coccoides]
MTDAESCIIIGAGISGLLAAQHLMRYDVEVTILEKSRGCGGRMAVKKMGESVFDSGAQFMTTRDMIFRERVESWLDKGEVLPWYQGPLKNMRYVGSKGMTTVPERIGASLNVMLSERVTKVSFKKKKWTVTTNPHGTKENKKYTANWLIMTAPVPQNLELLDASGIELDYDDEMELKKISYLRCLTVMAQLNGPSGIPNPGAMDLNHDVLRWLGDNSAKGISPVEGTITLHSSPKFADTYWDRPEEERIQAMLAAAKPFIKADVVEAISHRWGFSDPVRIYREKHPFRKPYFIDDEMQLGMAGDGFNGPRIEAAGLSGMDLAAAILSPV